MSHLSLDSFQYNLLNSNQSTASAFCCALIKVTQAMTKTMDSDSRRLKFKPWFCQDENLEWHWVSHWALTSLSPCHTHQRWHIKSGRENQTTHAKTSGTFQDDLKGFLLPNRIVSSSGQGTVVRETVCTQEWEEISHKQIWPLHGKGAPSNRENMEL